MIKGIKKKQIFNYLDKISSKNILVIGDIILDEYIKGDVSRISPEAPVPVVRVKKQKYLLGGSANVTKNLSTLSCKSYLTGFVGCDPYGNTILKLLKKNKINHTGVFNETKIESIVKTRVIAQNQQIVRIDFENNYKFIKSYFDKIKKFIAKKIPQMDVIIISDYGKGIITAEMISFIVELAKKKKIPIIVDPKVEHFMYYKNVTLMTPNRKEASEGINIKFNSNNDIIKAGKKIVEKLNLQSLIITRSEDGMTLFEPNKITNIPTEASEVYDVTGAGDTVVAVISAMISAGADFKTAAVTANIAAGWVVKEFGAASITLEKLKSIIKHY